MQWSDGLLVRSPGPPLTRGLIGIRDLVQGIKWSDRRTGPVAGRSERWTSTVQATYDSPEVGMLWVLENTILHRLKGARPH